MRDPAFGNAVGVFGSHYVCGYRSPQSNCPSSSNAVATGKPLWASENGSDDYNAGAQALARGINRDYLDGKMTGYINWPVIAAITPNIPWATTGVAVSPQPWSGYYSIGKNAWVMAQTTQFTAPGWHYLDSSSGYIGGNRNNGSYVSLKSINNGDYSTIIETIDAGAAQTLNFTVTGGLSTGAVHVWSTNTRATNPADFLRAGQRHHAVRRQLLAHGAARIRLQHHHHDRPGQGNGDQPGAGRPEAALQRHLRQLRGRPRSDLPHGPAGLVRGRRLRCGSRRTVRAADVGAGAHLLDVGPRRTVHAAGRPDLAQLHRLVGRDAREVRLRAAHRARPTPTTTRGRRTSTATTSGSPTAAPGRS